MQNLQSLMETLSGWVWGPYMLVLIVGTGIFLTFRLLFWQFRMLPQPSNRSLASILTTQGTFPNSLHS